jgi:hypothetical protein
LRPHQRHRLPCPVSVNSRNCRCAKSTGDPQPVRRHSRTVRAGPGLLRGLANQAGGRRPPGPSRGDPRSSRGPAQSNRRLAGCVPVGGVPAVEVLAGCAAGRNGRACGRPDRAAGATLPAVALASRGDRRLPSLAMSEYYGEIDPRAGLGDCSCGHPVADHEWTSDGSPICSEGCECTDPGRDAQASEGDSGVR